MAGILAVSLSKVMVSGDTAVDKAISGYITREQITLTTYPTGTSYAWSLAKPTTSGSSCDLSATSGASVAITPDVEGYYTVACLVDNTTTYVIRMSVAQVAAISTLTVVRFLPVLEASVPTPATGGDQFWSADRNCMVEKLSDGTIRIITVTTP